MFPPALLLIIYWLFLKYANWGQVNPWSKRKTTSKGKGFNQPDKPHKHWHIDIKYIFFGGKFYFIISIIDGFSRFIVNHGLFEDMKTETITTLILKRQKISMKESVQELYQIMVHNLFLKSSVNLFALLNLLMLKLEVPPKNQDKKRIKGRENQATFLSFQMFSNSTGLISPKAE